MQKFPVRPLFLALALAVVGAAVSSQACENGYSYGYRGDHRPYYGCEYGRKVVVVVQAPVKQEVVVQPKVVAETPIVVETPKVVETPVKLETPKVETPAPVEAAPVVTETAQNPVPVQK